MRVAASDLGISVAMATYNGGRFIGAQLASLRAQYCLPRELVVTDDGSSDDTLAQVVAFAKTAPFPVSVVRNGERLGWRGNFMKAAGLCRGELIAFCDQDDVWYERKLERMGALLEDERVLLAYHDADIVDHHGNPLGTLRAREVDRDFLPPRARPTTWSSPHGLTQVFRRVLLAFERYWPLSVDSREPQWPAAHDQWYYALASNLGCVRYTPERLLAYRQHGGNAVGFATARERRPDTPVESRRRNAAYQAMLGSFCRVLETAQRDGLDERLPEIEAALAANRRLLDHIRRDELAHTEKHMLRRLRHLGSLLQAQAYSRRSAWNLGYRALLNAALIGVPFGR